MKLMTNEIRKRLPALYSAEHDPDPVVQVKFFTPWTSWTWYAIEFDGEDLFFGLVDGLETELGYFTLSELESIRGPAGLRIERDRYFRPVPLSDVRNPGKLLGDENAETHNPYGGCPQCGQSTRFVSLLGDGWLVCRNHRTRWAIGNIFDTYDWEWKAWRTIERYLSFFRVVEPVFNEGPRHCRS